MNLSCLFLFSVLFVEIKSEGCSDDFFKCFSEFANSFFANVTVIEHVNADSVPEGYKQVKDVKLKTIEELTQSVQNELFKQLNSRVDDAVAITDNPKTQIYVKTFNHYFEDFFVPDFENVNIESDEHEVLAPFEITVKEERNKNNGSDQSTVLNLLTSDKESLSDSNDVGQKPIKTADEDIDVNKEINIDNHTVVQPDDTSSESTENTTVIEINSTISKETPVYNNEEKEYDMLDDFARITTHIIDFIFNQEGNIPELPTISESTRNTANVTQKVEENELAKDLPEKISYTNTNNDTSNINNTQNHKTPDDRTTTLSRDAQNISEKQFEKDIKENLIQTDDETDYEMEDATDYPQIDYIDLYKDTTNEENVYVTDSPKPDVINIKDEIVEHIEQYSLEIDTDLDNDTSTNICHGNTSDVSNIYPWIAAIFIKNDTSNNQFQYACDGALLGDKLLITAARCVTSSDTAVSRDDVLIFLGKRSLQNIREGETNVRILQIKTHANFSIEDGRVLNDLALLVLEEAVVFSDGIRPACLGSGGVGISATTAWDLSGAMTPVFFEKNSERCNDLNNANGTFCATYGNGVALCPSFGGVYATQHSSRWYLNGIRSGAPQTGICFDKDVFYTPLGEHLDWIMENME